MFRWVGKLYRRAKLKYWRARGLDAKDVLALEIFRGARRLCKAGVSQYAAMETITKAAKLTPEAVIATISWAYDPSIREKTYISALKEFARQRKFRQGE